MLQTTRLITNLISSLTSNRHV